jgi:hypothetical protein
LDLQKPWLGGLPSLEHQIELCLRGAKQNPLKAVGYSSDESFLIVLSRWLSLLAHIGTIFNNMISD